jgi:hypothetical protein
MTPQKSKETVVPLKVLCVVYGVHRDEHGEIVWEGPIGNERGPIEIALYKREFDKLDEKVTELWESENIEAQILAQNVVKSNGKVPAE